ncbi:hypothetical protein PanWU01x14_094810 [Parasponia andersonii]|uniref:Uncharacterized protein n=1 Tax=Parasponia andersonii TaxID=3476 RepID=A0A2P5D5C5_PARAD|nr:hypothetical protein PanWU01x14_094810 [Parasponia andersonii]
MTAPLVLSSLDQSSAEIELSRPAAISYLYQRRTSFPTKFLPTFHASFIKPEGASILCFLGVGSSTTKPFPFFFTCSSTRMTGTGVLEEVVSENAIVVAVVEDFGVFDPSGWLLLDALDFEILGCLRYHCYTFKVYYCHNLNPRL